MLFGAIEAGGTKMVVATGDEYGNIFKKTEIKTTTPEETVGHIKDFFGKNRPGALGIGAFGPVCVDENSSDYGRIGKTPKLKWTDFSWKEAFSDMGIPISVDTDVNAAAIGEYVRGNAVGIDDFIYITIGTGVGVGVMLNGEPLHGMLHPEAGHILLPINADDGFPGICPYHQNCFEGLASGPAMKKRYGIEPYLITEKGPWETEADYIAKAIMQYICCYSPKRIILGGGVMNSGRLFDPVRKKVLTYLNDYISTKELLDIDSYIVPAGLSGDQGITGALHLAQNAIRKDKENE
ncbi:MAG: ROK family protein [Acetatifactor sp.]|nr:ROK family protein [Acetatifactor sp.]